MDGQPLASVQVPGWDVEYVPAVGSTNALARDRPAGTVVVTDHQTAGRGRLDRTWETPAGVALTFSTVIDPDVPDPRWPWLPLLVGVAVAGVLREHGVRAGLKWPNDVLVEGRKVAGILVERVPGPLAVAGVGLNVHQTELPVTTATSLALEGLVIDRGRLLALILDRYSVLLEDWRAAGGAERLAGTYADLGVSLGRDVVVHLPGDRELRGRSTGIDGQGRLLVRDREGREHAVGAGDVVHLR